MAHRGMGMGVALAGLAVSAAAEARSGHLLGSAQAPVVVDGVIHRVTLEGGAPITGSTVDRLHFTALDPGHYAFNLLSWEVEFGPSSEGGPTGTGVDVNGDGESAFLDTHVRLFRDDGVLSIDDHLRSSDDEFVRNAAFADGSIYGYDSYLRVHLDPGNYILTVGAYFLSTHSAIGGLNTLSTTYPASWDDQAQQIVPNDHGDYRVTASYVPGPGSGMVLGLLGVAGVRRRRSGPDNRAVR